MKFWKNLDFAYAAANYAQLPPVSSPEVAFWGRSNVGKSSLINSLTERKSLARTSRSPGCTRTINFFTNSQADFYLVDLPGYAYAGVSKTTRKQWDKFTADYMKGRATLARVILLIDSRRKLMSSDLEAMQLCDQVGMSYQIVLTKVDLASQEELKAIQLELAKIANKHPAMHPIYYLTSSRRGSGLDELRQEIAAVVTQTQQTTV